MSVFKIKLVKKYLFRVSLFLIQKVIYKKKKLHNNRIKRILIVRLKHLGDFLLSQPTVHSIKKAFPEAEIDIVTGIWNRELVSFFGSFYAGTFFYNVKAFCRNKNQQMPFAKKMGVLKKISKRKYDICVDLDGSSGFLFIYLLKKIRHLVSLESLRFYQNLEQLKILKNRYDYNINRNHEIKNIGSILECLDIKNKFDTFKMPEKRSGNNKLSRKKEGNKIIGIHPSASIPEKLWTEKNFTELADILSKKYDAEIFFFGAEADKKQISRIIQNMNSRAVDCSGISIAEFIIGIKQCSYFICLDSFAQHVAYFQKVPALVLYMSTNSRRWTPEKSEYFKWIGGGKNNQIGIMDVLECMPPQI